MPQAIVVAAVSAAASTAFAVGAAWSWASFGVAFAKGLAVTAFSGLLSKSGKQQSQPTYQAEARDRLQTIRSAVETRRIVYGQAMVSGPLVYAESTGGGNEYLHLVIALAGHECEEIGDVYFNDEAVGMLDGSGNVTSGRFAGYARIKKHLGTTSQSADSDLVAESGGAWTSNHRLRGICYVYVRLRYSQDIFPNNIPNVKAVVKGKKVADPRLGSPTVTAWSDNWALCVRDYLLDQNGLGCSAGEIDEDAVIAAANICDEQVATNSGSPTTYQSRYTCNGTVNLADNPRSIMEGLLTAGAGALVYTQGRYRLLAGAYSTPAVDLDESDLRGGIQVQPRRPRRELYNGVRGTFSDPAKFWQPTDFPPVTNSTYETQDGGVQILRDIELPYTTDSIRAQLIAKIHLEKSRQGITVVLPCKYTAFKVRVWDTVRLSIERLGWVNKVFIVTGWKFSEAGGIDLELQEEAASVYDWAGGDATVLDTAPDTSLPNPFDNLTISGLTAASGTAQLLLQGDGTVVPRIQLTWTAPTNPFIRRYELQFAGPGSPTEWRDAPVVAAPATSGFLLPVKDGVAYDCRVRAVTTLGNAGDWATVTGHTVVGKTELPSDVTGFSAVQSGGVVVFGANTSSDADLDAIEIRLHDEGQTDWDNASPLTNILRGQTATSAAVPPGTWELLAKNRDTSGNYSANAARVTLTVTADGFTSIEAVEYAPDWQGALTNMVKHWTGVLTPQSQSLASALGWEVFDQFVPNAYADGYFEAAAIDKGIDAAARVYADIVSVLGPGETTGVANPGLEIDTRLDAGSYDGFEAWTIGTATFRHVKGRIHVDTTVGKPVISGFNLQIDAQSREETGTYTTGGGGSVAVVFDTPFHVTPVLQVTPQGSGDVSASYASLSGTGFTGYFKSGGAAAAGTASYTATGA